MLWSMKLEKTYQPGKFETDIYDLWEKSGAFAPEDRGRGANFSIIMPPPNANGSLHWGHAVGYTLTDVITRYKRMCGYSTLWLPGTDHAGIETQFVYERDILGPAGKSRLDFTPEQFFDEVKDFTLKQQGKILSQFRSMGFSPDWDRLKFTLDDDVVDIVVETFKKMHDDGHVYRGNRIVNWCTRCSAAFADIELEHHEQEDIMFTLDYGPVRVATVRPETIFADVAVAVNPKDKRYTKLTGKDAVIPLIDRPIPIITDDYVDLETGTGALKVTPGHDPNDYEIGQRHNLPEISVIDLQGVMINLPGEFAGLDVLTARKKVVEALEKAGKIVSTKKLKHQVAIHDRCGTQIEPLISEQWFLRIKDLNQPVIKAIEEEQVNIYPKRFKRVALNWLEQEHDWCISRDSCWWGIRMPVYYRTSHDQTKEPYLIARHEQEAKKYYGAGNYEQETATFDTWFSSGQWPYATLMTTGKDDFDTFYPTSLMGTAREILHKWVTRMIMFSLYRTGQVPFKDVYLWGLVTDEHGQKMSKSKGNIKDPLETTAEYGTDALRLAGAISNTAGTDSPMSEKRVEGMRNFCNKLWNIARYVEGVVGDDAAQRVEAKPVTKADHWMLAKLQHGAEKISVNLDTYKLNEATNAMYHLVWNDLADWYLEASKAAPNPAFLAYCLEVVLKLAHPFAPFVTETIWQTLAWEKDSLLIISPWPKVAKANSELASEFSAIQSLVSEVRSINSNLKKPARSARTLVDDALAPHAELMDKLAKITTTVQTSAPEGLKLASGGMTLWLDLDEASLRDLKASLTAKVQGLEREVSNLKRRLVNKSYIDNAPRKLVDETKAQLADREEQLKMSQADLSRL